MPIIHEEVLVDVASIFSDEDFNCRGSLRPMDVVDLVISIEEKGLLQPCIVRSLDAEAVKCLKLKTGQEYKYSLVAGHRRHKAFEVLAAKDKKWAKIPTKVVDNITEVEARVMNLAENLNRKELNIVQEARAIEKLGLFLGRAEIAKRLGASEGWVQTRMQLLALPDDVQQEAAAGLLPQTAIKTLHSVMQTSGVNAMYAAAREYKDAKAKGVAVNIAKHVTKNTKRIRSKTEILSAMTVLIDTLGASITTRVMAWTIGEISDDEVNADLKVYAQQLDKTFTDIMGRSV